MDVDPQTSSIWLQLLLIIALTLINAYFAASEMAIVSVNKNKIRILAESGNKKAKLVQKLIKEPTAFLSTIQIAITVAGFFNSASAATGISVRFAKTLREWHIPYGETISMIIITILLSFITLIFGELVPKRIALQNAEAYSMFCVRPIHFISKIASPIIKVLSSSTKFVLRILGVNDENVEELLSREEIRSVIESGQENGVFNEIETEMINNIFEFDDIQAQAIMTPRKDVYCININEPLEEYMDEIMEMHYTRIPVYDESIDDIIGILHIKDFMIEAHKHKYDFEKVDLKNILRKAYFVLETKNIDELFRDLQKYHQHIAILIDEYGGFSGIVTIEDLIEEIMGEIEDEYDYIGEPKLKKIDENTYLVNGLMNLQDFNNELCLEIENYEHDTLSGYLLNQIGKILEDGTQTSITIKNINFDIIKVIDKHIETIQVTILQNKDIIK